jgi:predicted permease
VKLWRRRRDDIDEEIATHLAMAASDREERGESPKEARIAAAREFGNTLLVREVTRSIWGWEWLDRLMQDLRYAWLQIRRSPGFSLTVMTTLAIGLGATAAMFTIVNRVLLQVLPYPAPQRLVAIEESGRRGNQQQAPWPDIEQWQLKTRSFEDIGFYVPANGRPFLEGDTAAEQVGHYRVSTNLFSVLGVKPEIGHGFDNSKERRFVHRGDENTVVLSDAVWRDAFGAKKGILGRVVKISGQPYTVVGVMPRGFTFPTNGEKMQQVWTGISFQQSDDTRDHPSTFYMVIARLKRGVRVSAAEAEMKVVQADVAKLYTDPYSRDLVTSATVAPYGNSLVKPEVRHALLALFGASGVLWFIACINVTGLLLARATVRQREIAIRGALGASRDRIVRQLMVEGLLLSMGGSFLGLGLAIGLLKIFAHGLATQLSIRGVMPDGRVILVLLALTVGSAILSAMVPAWSSAQASIERALRQGGGQAGPSRGQHRLRSLLVVTQIAMSLVLLVSCGLLLRTIYTLRHVPLGFRTDHILVGNMEIPSYRFTGEDLGSKLYTPLLERVKALPGVETATLMTEVPLGHTFNVVFSFNAEGNSADAVRKRDFRAQLRVVGPDAQKVFGFSMLKGRFFNGGDTPGSQAAVVVNHAFVKEFSQTNDPEKIIGKQLISLEKGKPAVVVGVLDDIRQVSVAKQSQPELEVYLPQLTPTSMFYKAVEGIAMDLVVRTERPLSSIIPEIKELMRKASPELANTNFSTMDQIVEDSYGNQQIMARLLIIFGCSALLLCLSGVYGLLTQLVTQRTREIGVRMALGAGRGAVLWLVMRQAGRMLLAGALIGLALVYLSGRLLTGFLYGVAAHDAWTLAIVSAFLLASGLAAAYLPARRAAMIDPMKALRAE